MNNSYLKHIQNSFSEGFKILESFKSDSVNLSTIEKMGVELARVFEAGGKVLSCGNGGSACDSLHFAEEFTGQFRAPRKPLPALSLTESAHITCVANDYGFEEIFSRGVEA